HPGRAQPSPAADLRHPALRVRRGPGDRLHQAPRRALAPSGGLRGPDRGGAVRPAVHRHQRPDLARAGLARRAGAGFPPHRAFEGWPAIARGLSDAGPETWAAVLWQSVGNSLFGYAAWAWLLARHPAATITPMALLIPVFGLGASALLLGEPMPPWKLAATAL